MKCDWKTKALAETCTFFADGDWIESKDQSADGIRLIQTGNVGEGLFKDRGDKARFISYETFQRLRCSEIFEGDCLVSRLPDPVGRSCILPDTGEQMITAVDCTIIRFDPQQVIPEFFNFYSQSSDYLGAVESETTGTTRKRISRSKLGQITIPVPPLQEQHRIVAILEEAFDSIDTAKANAEMNLQNSREIFRSILNAAITGELTSSWRNCHSASESASEKLARVLTKRSNQSKRQSKYSEPQPPVFNKPINIPASWVMASPEQLSIHIIDCPHSTPKWTDAGEICLRTTNFKPRQLDLETVRFVSKETYNERIARLEPKPGDVLYSREGGILGVACIIPEGLKACLGQRMMQFRLDTNVVLPMYFASVLNSGLILSEVRSLTGGAASPHLNIRDIRTFPIPLPPIEEQQEIVTKLESAFVETQRLESIYQQKLAALGELKKSLLHQAFSGSL